MVGLRSGYGLALLIPLAACGNSFGGDSSPGIAGTGSGDTRSYPVDGFTAVALEGPDDVDVRVGSAFSVRAQGNESELAKLKIERKGDTLEIGRIRKYGIGWSSGKGVRITVTMPRITAAELASSGNLSVDRAESPSFKGDLAGSGNLSIAGLATGDAKFSIAGSGNVKAGGHADRLVVDIAGSGDFDAADLAASGAKISIAGSGGVRAKVTGDAKVDILGSGDVDLGPGAKCSTNKMGSGSVRCG